MVDTELNDQQLPHVPWFLIGFTYPWVRQSTDVGSDLFKRLDLYWSVLDALASDSNSSLMLIPLLTYFKNSSDVFNGQ